MTDATAVLVFDSWMDSIPECRNRKSEDRHLIYEGGGIVLDILLRQEGDKGHVHVGGQVLSPGAPNDNISEVSVQMELGGQCSTIQTNAFGEFSFQAIPQGSIDLCIKLPGRRVYVRGLAHSEPHMWQVVAAAAAGGER